MTYVEHRNRSFLTVYSRKPVKVADNLTIIATYNPTDRSAIELDSALLRRLRIIRFPPDTAQLKEMLANNGIQENVIGQLEGIFSVCRRDHPDDFEHLMPFGHGIFSSITSESPDLHELWTERIEHLLKRPLIEPHPFTTTIENNYPWRDIQYKTTSDN